MARRRTLTGCELLWALSVTLAVGGCAGWQGPRIDPSGERIFLPPGSPAPALPPPNVPTPLNPALALPQGVSLLPSQVVAPVGSEVLLVATIVGGSRTPLAGQRVEWTLEPGGVGSLVEISRRGWFGDFLNRWHGIPKKLDRGYAVNATLWQNELVDRGTPTPVDDVLVQAGQAWISVTSPVEGVSHVTAMSPDVAGWDRRKQISTIYWMDARVAYPPPAVSPVGGTQPLTTVVSRQSDGAPLVGWLVRYEAVGGPAAGFGQDLSAAVEATTNDQGQATVELAQRQRQAGSNQVNIQVIRPAQPGAQRLAIGSGATTCTWTSTDITLRVSGPIRAQVGATATFRIEVTNPGAAAAAGVVVADQAPAQLAFVNSNPAAEATSAGQVWRLPAIGAGQTLAIEANYRVAQSGQVEFCATATGAAGQSAKGCTRTLALAAAAPAPLEPAPREPSPTAPAASPLVLGFEGPLTAEVNGELKTFFRLENRGTAPLTGVVLRNRLDRGLEHASGVNPLETDVGELAAGGVWRKSLTLKVTQSGRLCQNLEVTSNEGAQARGSRCVTVADSAAAPPPTPGPTPAPGPGRPALALQNVGPKRRAVGEVAEFVITVTNTGNEPLTNVKISASPDPPMLEAEEATEGFQQTTRSFDWTVAALAPGKSITRRLNCRCTQRVSEVCNRVVVTADPNLQAAEEACLEIVAAGGSGATAVPRAAAAGQLSLAIESLQDSLAVGQDATYQVTITADRDQPERNVVLTLTAGEGSRFIRVTSPQGVRASLTERSVRYQPIAELRAGESVRIDVTMRAAGDGPVRLRAEATSDRQRTPVAAERETRSGG